MALLQNFSRCLLLVSIAFAPSWLLATSYEVVFDDMIIQHDDGTTRTDVWYVTAPGVRNSSFLTFTKATKGSHSYLAHKPGLLLPALISVSDQLFQLNSMVLIADAKDQATIIESSTIATADDLIAELKIKGKTNKDKYLLVKASIKNGATFNKAQFMRVARRFTSYQFVVLLMLREAKLDITDDERKQIKEHYMKKNLEDNGFMTKLFQML